MAPGFLLAVLLTQAEPAPDAAPTPTTPVASPAPAQAPSAVPTPPDPGPMPLEIPTNFLGVGLGVGRRIGPVASDVPPTFGLSVAMAFGHRYAEIGILQLGGAFHFGYERYAKDVTITATPDGQPTNIDGLRSLTHYDFAVQQTAALALTPVRPFAAVGVGLHLAHFASLEPAFAPGESRATRPSVRAEIGIDGRISAPDTRIGLAFAYEALLGDPTFATSDGRTLHLFGDRLTANAWLRYGF